KLFVAVVLLTLSAGAPVGAQDLGIAGSYGVGLLEGSTTTVAWSDWCGCDSRGTSLAQRAFVAVTMLVNNKRSRFAAQASMGIGSGVAQFISPTYASGPADIPPDATLEFRETLRTISFRANIEGRVPIGGEAALTFGPWIESNLQTTRVRTEHVILPTSAVFPNASTERTIVERTPAEQSTIRWGLTSGASLSIEVSPGITVLPHLLLQTDIPSLTNGYPGGLLLTAGSSVVLDISGTAQASTPLETPLALPDVEQPRDEIPASPLRASIDVYALRDDGMREQTALVQRETIYRRIVAQVPREIGAHGVDSFLTIVGTRMALAPGSRIQLSGSRNKNETRGAGIARASVMRDSLAINAAIDRRRISVSEFVASGSIASIRIESTPETLLAPEITEWLDERYHMPSIGVDRTIDAQKGIRSSRLRILRNGATLADTSLARDGVIPEIEIDLSDATHGGTIAPIIAELDIVDSAGATARAFDTLPLELAPIDTSATHTRERLTFVVDVCRESIKCHEQEMLDELRKAIRRGARVELRVTGGRPLATQTHNESTVDTVRGLLDEMGIDVVEIIDTRDANTAALPQMVIEVRQRAE
ncbi:MAG: hypothetical protein H7X80_05580, partial [bacterium]|nr:hypothetical protein [Candidatus Kapabacteria bacterium]